MGIDEVNMYHLLKWAHIVSSTFLLAVSIGMAALPLEDIRNASATVTMNRLGVVIVRAVVSLAVFSQAASAFAIAWIARYPLHLRWLEWSMALFALLCCFWLAMAWFGGVACRSGRTDCRLPDAEEACIMKLAGERC